MPAPSACDLAVPSMMRGEELLNLWLVAHDGIERASARTPVTVVTIGRGLLLIVPPIGQAASGPGWLVSAAGIRPAGRAKGDPASSSGVFHKRRGGSGDLG